MAPPTLAVTLFFFPTALAFLRDCISFSLAKFTAPSRRFFTAVRSSALIFCSAISNMAA